jgi:hypothetical protein
MAIAACERLASDIRAGRLSVVKISLVDEDRFGFAVEALDLSDEEPEAPASPAVVPTVAGPVAVASGCPRCGSAKIVDASAGLRVCLDCNMNFAPSGAPKE